MYQFLIIAYRFYFVDPTDGDDAVTRRYVASRFHALRYEIQGNKSKLGAFLNLLGVVNNQVVIRVYELIDTDIRFANDFGDAVLFRKYQHEPGDIEVFKLFDMFTRKDKFMSHLLEETVDDMTWLRIKQPGTYTIHFDLIYSSSFSFELHTRAEIIHFSEHNPKHHINLEKVENCLLVYKKNPSNYSDRFKNICLL